MIFIFSIKTDVSFIITVRTVMIKETSVFMEKMNITNQEHDAFVKAHPQGDLLQLTKWAETKKLSSVLSIGVIIVMRG